MRRTGLRGAWMRRPWLWGRRVQGLPWGLWGLWWLLFLGWPRSRLLSAMDHLRVHGRPLTTTQGHF
jgi:hypothetical protein